MGDNTNRKAHERHGGDDMNTLMSAIEYQKRMLNSAGYPNMEATTQDMAKAEETERIRLQHQLQQQQVAALYQNLPASALAPGMANPLWNLNPLLMQLVPPVLPGLRPGLGTQANLLQPISGHERDTLGQSELSGLSGAKTDTSDTINGSEIANLPFGYSRLPYMTNPAISGLQTDKITSVHEPGKGLRYPNPSNVSLSQYLNLPGYQNLLSAHGLIPSVVPGALNPAAIGALAGYPAMYQTSLMQRLPYISQLNQNAMLRMPLPGSGLGTPPTQPQEALRPESPMRSDQRPQSGGYNPLKENLQRRLSAPNSGSGTQFRMPHHSETLSRVESGGSNAPYPGYPHRLPPQLVAPTSEAQRSHRSHMDNKTIGQRISDIISENEKILCSSSALEKVKPRRVFRRSSLDPATLNPPAQPSHPPLTATHSAPRSFDTKYTKLPTKEHPLGVEKPNFLSVPSRLAESSNPTMSTPRSPYMTVIPDPRRDPNARPYIPNPETFPRPEHSIKPILKPPYRERVCCEYCGGYFASYELYETHKAKHCVKRPPPPTTSDSTLKRQSVIQHTALQSDEETTQTQTKPDLPNIEVTPPRPQPDLNPAPISDPIPPKQRRRLEHPFRHKDLIRTHSADSAFLPRRLIEPSPQIAPLISNPSPAPPSSSPPKSDSSDPGKGDSPLPATKSSIPTNKLPPKKKQLQLMRSNNNSSNIEPTRSPDTSPMTSDLSSSETKTQDESPTSSNNSQSLTRKVQPPTTLSLSTPPPPTPTPPPVMSRPWLPRSSSNVISPTIYMTQPSPTHVGSSTALLPSPTGGKSPTSPKSPSRRLSPGRTSRSPSRSPTNLESTVPRSNYKLLLHQMNMRNMKDMGYLSEAYRHSKDKSLKRNIASLLWSSMGKHSLESDGTATKRMRPFPGDGPSMEELYPGKASLARRLSPNNIESRSKYPEGELSPAKLPLGQSRSRPYESTLKAHPPVTRSHSAGYSSDVNNNIKQFLQNKSRNQQALRNLSSGTSQPSNKHKPLTRTNANARYLLNTAQSGTSTSGQAGSSVQKSPLEARNSMSKIDATQRLKESLALKRAASYNPDSSGVEYPIKRQKLIPIADKTTTSSHSLPPTALVSSRLSNHVSTKSDVKELPKMKSSNARTVQTPFLLHPHGSPSLGFEPHPTFCSLVSPQPMYVELRQSTLSMYSQWAVSEPLLPKGMTVMDIFESTRFVKALSPYTSYNSLFTTPKETEYKMTDTKDYERDSKQDEMSKNKVEKDDKGVENSTEDELEAETSKKSDDKAAITTEESKVETDTDSKSEKEWMFSQFVSTNLHRAPFCYTSCHNKALKTPLVVRKPKTLQKQEKIYEKTETEETEKKFPKLPPPKVVIHPPSSSESVDSDSDSDSNIPSPKNCDIASLEVSDCDTDDDVIKEKTQRPFLNIEKGSTSPPSTTPSESGNENTQKMDSNSKNDQTSSDLTNPSDVEMTLKSSEGRSSSPQHNGSHDHPVLDVQHKLSDASHDSDKGQSSNGEKGGQSVKKHKKIRKSRKERNASSPRLHRRIDGSPDSPPSALEDPSLAVHPIGACSDDPAKICALCRMKAGRSEEDGSENIGDEEGKCNGKVENCGKSDESDTATKPGSPSDRPDTPNRPHTPTTPRVRTPTSTRPKTPLTVSVPKRSRDRSSSKSGSQPLTPGILDKARGKGMTQHWVTSTELQSPSHPTPKMEDSAMDKPQGTTSEAKSASKNRNYSSSEYFSTMPPNKNPHFDLNLNKSPDSPPAVVAQNGGGLQALAAVVSGVMRSAAMQSKKKPKTSKNEMTELLSHSRPLISDLNGSVNNNHSRVKSTSELERTSEKTQIDSSLGSLANLTATVGPNRSKPGLRHLSLSTRESELFLNKANETRTGSVSEGKTDTDGAKLELDLLENQDLEDGHHSDSAKEDIAEVDGESSSNPRPHKCSECKVAFRIAGHLAKHLRSKGHIVAMQKKTLNRLKLQKLSTVTNQEVIGQVSTSCSAVATVSNEEQNHQPSGNQEELLNQLGEGAVNLAQSQVRALFEGSEEYAEINTGEGVAEALAEASDEEGELTQAGCSDPRPFKCIVCKVAFRFQGHLDRHFRSNTHLLAVGHYDSAPTGHTDLPPMDEAFVPVSEQKTDNSEDLSLKISESETPMSNSDQNSSNPQSEILNSNGDTGLVEQSVNPEILDSDWQNNVSIKIPSPVNGLRPHSDSDSYKPVNQTNSKAIFESPPPIPEMPLPSSSPVQKRQQLTC